MLKSENTIGLTESVLHEPVGGSTIQKPRSPYSTVFKSQFFNFVIDLVRNERVDLWMNEYDELVYLLSYILYLNRISRVMDISFSNDPLQSNSHRSVFQYKLLIKCFSTNSLRWKCPYLDNQCLYFNEIFKRILVFEPSPS